MMEDCTSILSKKWEALRGRCCEIDETQKNIEVWKPFELDLKLDSRKCRISVGDDLMFEADGREACLRLSEKAGAGRKQRKAVIPSGRLKELRDACGHNSCGNLSESRGSCFLNKILSGKNDTSCETGSRQDPGTYL